MGQQQISATFPQNTFNGQPATIVDFGSGQPVLWSQGATAITPVPIQPPLSERWSVLSWTITFRGFFYYAPVAPVNGKLGKIFAGLIRGAIQTPFKQWTNPMLPAPNGPISFAVVWDGQQDAAFPSMNADGITRPLTNFQSLGAHTEVLSQPFEILPGDGISIGLWLTPGLGINLPSVMLSDVSYVLTCDDGAAPIPGWGGR